MHHAVVWIQISLVMVLSYRMFGTEILELVRVVLSFPTRTMQRRFGPNSDGSLLGYQKGCKRIQTIIIPFWDIFV
jgi:hypothetical protein